MRLVIAFRIDLSAVLLSQERPMHMQAPEPHRLTELPPLAREVYEFALADEGFDDEDGMTAWLHCEEDLLEDLARRTPKIIRQAAYF